MDGSTAPADFKVEIVHGYYPSWRAATHPPSKFDFSSVNRVGHCFAYPSTEGELIIPPELLDPALVTAVHAHGAQVSLVLEDNTPDIARAIGLGPLNVVRHRPRWRSPYTGTVPLVSGEVAGDLTLYLTESEQTPSAMGLGVSFGQGMADVAACGFLVQALPGATDEELEIVEKNVAELPGLATLLEHPITPDDLIDRLLVGLGSRARHAMSPRFHCPCTHERALRTLALLERSEILEMIEKQEGQEVVCDFCGKEYQIAASAMSPILEFQNEQN